MPCNYARNNWSHPLLAFFGNLQPETEGNSEAPKNGNDTTGETFWHQLLDMVDDGILDYVKKASLQDQSGKDKSRPKHYRSFKKNPIDPVCTVVEVTEGKFAIRVRLSQTVKPEDVNLSIKDRHVIIRIKLEKSSEDGTSTLEQVFTKKVALPEEAKAEEVKSHLTPEGILKIEVPLPVPEAPAKPEPVNIPVSVLPGQAETAGSSNEVDIEFPKDS